MHFESSPSSTSPSKPISIGRMTSSPSSSIWSFQSSTSGSPYSSQTSTCAYPSWPQSSSLGSGSGSFRSTAPSSYLSDEDLFMDDLEDGLHFLTEPPAPPREVFAQPLLPLYAEKPKKKRRSSAKKPRQSSKPMTPISESPETPE